MSPDSRQSPAGHGVAVALSSAAFGFFSHAGFMAELHREGVFPSQMAGTSAGALTSLLCGVGMRGEALVDFFMQPGLRRSFWDWGAPLRFPGVLSMLFFSGIFSFRNMDRFLRDKLGSPLLQDMHEPKVQFSVTNLTQHRAEIVSKGDAVAYALASCAIPGLICNQVVDGDRWCDGGVADPVPFCHWLTDDSVHTIIMHRMQNEHGSEFVTPWPSLASGFSSSHRIIADTIVDLRLDDARKSGKRIIDIVTEVPQARPFQRKQHPQLVEAGRQAGREAVKQLLA